MRLCLVRHGETDWNVENRLQGWTDVPLNAAGLAQAQAVAHELAGVRFDAIVASPLARARATAECIARGRPVVLDARWRERHLGQLQGLTRAEVAVHHPAVHAALAARRPDYAPPEGESASAFAARVQAALDDCRRLGKQVLVVAHGGVLDMVYRQATGQDLHSPRQHALPNAALNWLRADTPGWRVEAWGQTEHLTDTLDERGA